MFEPQTIQAMLAGGVIGTALTALVMAFKAVLVRKTESEASFRDDFKTVTEGLTKQLHMLEANWKTDSERKEQALAKGRAELATCIDRCKQCEAEHEEAARHVKVLEGKVRKLERENNL